MNAINVAGNVEGSIVMGNGNKIETHNHYGAVINQQEVLPVHRRSFSPKPPAELDCFVGRKRELKQVDEWIAQNKIVIIQGVDGIGKTCLLKEAANSETAKSRPDGVVFQDGLDEEGKLLEFGDVVQRLFDALFESQPRLKVDLSIAKTYLSNTQPLVVFNSIALSAQSLSQLQNLFSKIPILIATENSALLRGNKNTIPLGPLDRKDSLDLLVSLTNLDDQKTLVQIATLLENMPAALSMVADTIRVDGLQVDDVLRRLQSYHPREENKAKAAVERAFRLVYSILPENQRSMLDQVAASYGVSVDRKWLEDLYGGSAVSEELEERGLLYANSPRLRLMPGLRPLILQDRDLSKEQERLQTYLLTELRTRWNDFEFIKDELGNLLGLLYWSSSQGQWGNVATIGRSLDPYLTLNGLWGTWHKTLEVVQQAAQAMHDLPLQGWVLHQLGSYEIGVSNPSAASRLLNQAISIRKKLGDQTGAAYSQHNLQGLIPVTGPAPNFGTLLRWLLGGLALLALGFYLFFNRPPTFPTQQAPVPDPIQINSSPSAIPTLTPSSTAPATITRSPTITPTESPTYGIVSHKSVIRAHAPCHYGPGDAYQHAGIAFSPGNFMDVLGRNEDATWLRVNYSSPYYLKGMEACWMQAKDLDISIAEILSVAPVEPDIDLPFGDRISFGTYIPDPVVEKPVRKGDTVYIYWSFWYLPDGEVEDPKRPRYLIEAWVCEGGKIVFRPSGWPYPYDQPHQTGELVSASIKDEAGCTEPSHARLYLSWKHGYLPPVEIQPWPQNETVLLTP